MFKKLFFLAVILAFPMSLAVPAGPVMAEAANQVDFTGRSYDFCGSGGVDDFCYPGDLEFKPSGKMFIVGFQTIIKFNASDPRWNADCHFTADPFSPSDHNPLMGSFICYPTDPMYAGGWWEGTVRQVFMTDKFVGNWSGKGYGTFDRLVVNAYNSMSSHNGSDHGFGNIVGTIIELPDYEP